MADCPDDIDDDRVVSVFGSGLARVGQPAYRQAMAVGRKLAELGYAVANGGYGGTMAAAAQGASRAGGKVIGVTCSIWSSQPNPYLDRVISTGSLPERIQTLIELGRSGYVVLPGATGTLAELAWVWELAFKGLLARAPDGRDRPIVCVGRFWQPLMEMMDSQRPGGSSRVAVVSDAGELGSYFPAGAG